MSVLPIMSLDIFAMKYMITSHLTPIKKMKKTKRFLKARASLVLELHKMDRCSDERELNINSHDLTTQCISKVIQLFFCIITLVFQLVD